MSPLGLRVTFLTHFFPPEIGAAPGRVDAVSRGLARQGVQVTIHTGFPHYPDGRIKPPFTNRPLVRERRAGVRIVRSGLYATPNRGFARRLASQASFAAWAAAVAPLTPPADIVVVHSPPLVLGAAGIAYAKLKRAPYVLHVSDLYPDSAIALGMLRRPGAIRAARAMEARCYRHAAAVTAPAEGIVRQLAERPGVPPRVRHIHPLVELERFDSTPRAREGPLRVLYAGAVGRAHGLETLVEAAASAGGNAVELWIAGDGEEAPAIRALIASLGAGHVKMLGMVPPDRIPALYREADIGAVVLRDRPLFRSALPTKLFETMAAGRPVLLSGAGEAAALVRRHDVGSVVPPEDPSALAAALLQLGATSVSALATQGARGRALAADYSHDRAIAQWLSLLSELGQRSAGPDGERIHPNVQPDLWYE